MIVGPTLVAGWRMVLLTVLKGEVGGTFAEGGALLHRRLRHPAHVDLDVALAGVLVAANVGLGRRVRDSGVKADLGFARNVDSQREVFLVLTSLSESGIKKMNCRLRAGYLVRNMERELML